MLPRLLKRLAIFSARDLIFLEAGIVFANLPSEFLWRAVAAVTVAWLVTLSLEYIVRRRRPYQKNHEKPLVGSWPLTTPSFPSGHATIAFALAAAAFTRNLWFGGIISVVAALVAWGRVRTKRHYVSDVVVGAVLGLVISLAIL